MHYRQGLGTIECNHEGGRKMNVRIFVKCLLLFAVALLFSSCAQQARVNIETLACDPKTTPPGERCLIDYASESTTGDGTITRALFTAGGTCTKDFVGEDGKTHSMVIPCPVELHAAKYVDDRGNTLLKTVAGPAVGAVGDVLSARQIKLGWKYQADRAGSSDGGDIVFLNENLNNSGATSQQGTEVGVGVGINDCPSGSCYDPTQ
jgi:hypothetical protein